MGVYSSESETKSTTETAPLSGEGVGLQDLYTDAMLAYMRDTAGYDITSEEKTKYAKPEKVDKYNAQIAGYDNELTRIQAQIDQIKAKGSNRGVVNQQVEQLQNQLYAKQRERDTVAEKLAKQEKVTYQDYTLTKKEDVRVQAAIDKYGANSNEVAGLREEIKSQEVSQAYLKSDTEKEYLEAMNKYVRGDITYSAEQKAAVAAYTDPIRDTILRTTDELLNVKDDRFSTVAEHMNTLMAEIDKSGLDTISALEAAQLQTDKEMKRLGMGTYLGYKQVGEQAAQGYEAAGREMAAGFDQLRGELTSSISDFRNAAQANLDKSKTTILGAIAEANKSAENKAKFQFDLLSQKADTKAAQQAALFGLPPGSGQERAFAEKMKMDAMGGILVQLDADAKERTLSYIAQNEAEKNSLDYNLFNESLAINQSLGKKGVNAIAQGKLQGTQARETAGNTAQGALTSIEGSRIQNNNQINLQKADVTANTGAQRVNTQANFANFLATLKNDQYNRLSGIVEAKGQSLQDLAKSGQNMLYGAAYGNLAGAVSGGQSAQAFDLSQKAAAGQTLQQGIANVFAPLQIEQQRSFAESTQNSKTTTSPSAFSVFTDLAGVAASGAGAVMGGVGALKPAATAPQNFFTFNS